MRRTIRRLHEDYGIALSKAVLIARGACVIIGNEDRARSITQTHRFAARFVENRRPRQNLVGVTLSAVLSGRGKGGRGEHHTPPAFPLTRRSSSHGSCERQNGQ